MTDPKDINDWHFIVHLGAEEPPVVGLDQHPEIARLVAVFLNCFSIIELQTSVVLMQVLDISNDECGAILATFRNYNDHLKLIRELLSIRLVDENGLVLA